MAANAVRVENRINWFRLLTESTKQANAIIEEVARTSQEKAKENSPHKTGHNRSTITWDKNDKGYRLYTQSGYGLYLEIRVRKPNSGEWTGRSPYIAPAIQDAIKAVQQKGRRI